MKAMSVRAPWAYLFFWEYFNHIATDARFLPPGSMEPQRIELPYPKNCENRRRSFGGKPSIIGQLDGHRGALLIHVSKSMDIPEKQWSHHFGLVPGRIPDLGFPRGCLIGIVDVAEIRFQGALRNAHASPWHDRMAWGIYVQKPRLLPEPVAYKGQLGIFDVDEALLPEGAIA